MIDENVPRGLATEIRKAARFILSALDARAGRHVDNKKSRGHVETGVLMLHIGGGVEAARRDVGVLAGNGRGDIPARVLEQAYVLRVREGHATLTAEGLAGVRFGLRTLRQAIEGGKAMRRMPAMDLVDWPDFASRGVMLDISRDKVPTMATLRRLIEMLAAWKFNELQLYMEHTFAYRGHEAVWRNASPMTPAQIRSLDRLCLRHGIMLVPNQNSLGHMERWLQHARYAPLAEYDGPYQTPWGETRTTPTTLNPIDPRSLRLVADLYAQLLPCFSSGVFNVGCDEPFELGQGKSRRACERLGAGRVYFDYLMKIRRAARAHGRRIQFWSDWIQREPDRIGRLPADVMALVWGYEADHPFDAECERPMRRGLDFYVCPGTSSWCSFSGRTTNMLRNLRHAAAAGAAHGALGYLVTDWGDFGHRQYLPVSYAGFLVGAGMSWCRPTNEQVDPAKALSMHVFREPDGRLARGWLEAGRVHEGCGKAMKNRTILFAAMQARLDDTNVVRGLRRAAVERARRRIAGVRRMIAGARPACEDGRLIVAELRATLDVLDHACCRLLVMIGLKKGSASKRTLRALLSDIRKIMDRHARLWQARNRAGGLADSLRHYERLADEYAGFIAHA